MKLVLYDGKTIDGLKKNVDVYISNRIIDPYIFEGNLILVKEIYDDETEVELKNLKLIGPAYNSKEDTWEFLLIPIPIEELRYAQTRSDIMYIAMMSDVELGEEPEGLSIY